MILVGNICVFSGLGCVVKMMVFRTGTTRCLGIDSRQKAGQAVAGVVTMLNDCLCTRLGTVVKELSLSSFRRIALY